MGRDSICDLRGLLPPEQTGINSPHAVAVAYHLMREHELTAHLRPVPKTTASVDDLLACHALFADSMEYRIQCCRGSIWAIRFPRPRDLEHCQKDMGELPRTWKTVCNGGCKGEVWWFAAPLEGPDLAVGERIHATNAVLLRSTGVPGSKWRTHDGTLGDERHQWVEHYEAWRCPLSELPAKWLHGGLPIVGGLKLSAAPSRRFEWNARAPHSPLYVK